MCRARPLHTVERRQCDKVRCVWSKHCFCVVVESWTHYGRVKRCYSLSDGRDFPALVLPPKCLVSEACTAAENSIAASRCCMGRCSSRVVHQSRSIDPHLIVSYSNFSGTPRPWSTRRLADPANFHYSPQRQTVSIPRTAYGFCESHYFAFEAIELKTRPTFNTPPPPPTIIIKNTTYARPAVIERMGICTEQAVKIRNLVKAVGVSPLGSTNNDTAGQGGTPTGTRACEELRAARDHARLVEQHAEILVLSLRFVPPPQNQKRHYSMKKLT